VNFTELGKAGCEKILPVDSVNTGAIGGTNDGRKALSVKMLPAEAGKRLF
jgi:hypothetical protein